MKKYKYIFYIEDEGNNELYSSKGEDLMQYILPKIYELKKIALSKFNDID